LPQDDIRKVIALSLNGMAGIIQKIGQLNSRDQRFPFDGFSLKIN
jgi:hypothetical protein